MPAAARRKELTHDASRDALLAEATQRAGRDTGAVLAERLRQAQVDGVSPLAALVQAYLADAQLENAECGCVVAALASEIPRQAEEVGSAECWVWSSWCAARERARKVRRAAPGPKSLALPGMSLQARG